VPLAAGNWWVLGATSGERLELRATDERSSREGDRVVRRVVRVDDSNGDWRLVALAADGSVLLVELHLLGQAPATFEPPLAILPAGIRAGERHEQESALRAFDPSGDIEPQEGSARVQAAVGRPESVRTPAGAFTDCLPVEGQLELSWRDGTESQQTFRLWLAPGVGPVRLLLGPAGSRAPDLLLLEARVGERVFPAER
jgi:hypothetical protein